MSPCEHLGLTNHQGLCTLSYKYFNTEAYKFDFEIVPYFENTGIFIQKDNFLTFWYSFSENINWITFGPGFSLQLLEYIFIGNT
jgi:hypothetical protein